MNQNEIKARLSKTWVPFFSRFGSFTPIQEMSMPMILDGENALVISPAASGKTEAVIAPIIERLSPIDNLKSGKIAVLYISPTRALVNDLYRRLCEQVEYCGLTIGRKTGDLPRIDPRNMPNILITTPESFDSLICREPGVFLELKAVVIDEIHLLDNTPRGDQVRVLLNRLRKIRQDIQYCALSATIDDLSIGQRYFDNARVCLLPSARKIDFDLIAAKDFIVSFPEVIEKHGFNKILIFFNARSLAELLSQQLRFSPFQDSALVHHASLPKDRREEAERAMNQSSRAILCATSTLELGIDIGDIDCVVLYRPPYNVSSLLQRIGRGNRRTNTLYAIGVYQNFWEKTLLEVFLDCARTGKLYERRYQTGLAVIPQQLYSYLYQRRRLGTTINCLREVMIGLYTDNQIRSVMRRQIADNKIVENRPGIYQLSYGLESKIKYGKIHSNIAEISFGEYDVIDAGNNAIIGRIFHLKRRFVLGGRCWAVTKIDEKDKKVYARKIGEIPEFAAIFEGKGAGNYNYSLSSVLKQRFYPGLESMAYPYTIQKKNTYLLHFLGGLYGFLLADALDLEGIEALDIDGKILLLNDRRLKNERLPIPKPESFKQIVMHNLARLEDALGSGAYFYDLPRDLQIEDHWNNLDLAGFLEFLKGIQLVQIEPKVFNSVVDTLTK